MSRRKALKRRRGKKILSELAHQGIHARAASFRGSAEEVPMAYNDVTAVVDSTHKAGLAKKGCNRFITAFVCDGCNTKKWNFLNVTNLLI